MSIPNISRLFVKLKVPYPMIPRGGKKAAGKIAKDFSVFIDGLCNGFNEKHGTKVSPAEALRHLLDQNIKPESMFDEYRQYAEQARQFIAGPWLGAKGYESGWKWL